MTTRTELKIIEIEKSKLPTHGWVGLSLAIVFWFLNWLLPGTRTHWGFFPMWLGYCLAIDGLVLWRTSTSLLTRSWQKYVGLFLISSPVWWLFELLNLRTQNWIYIGTDLFTPAQYAFWTTLSFSTVIPAVFGSAELVASFGFLQRLKPGPVLGADKRTTSTFFFLGWAMLVLMLAWPKIFFPFLWLSLYFILEPVNVRMGNCSLGDWTKNGDWRPAISLWLGILLTGFFWEMWNYFSYPKWVYHVPWGGWLHIFEMPLLGYGGYLPFALELYAIYHLAVGLLGNKSNDYVRVTPE